MNLDALKEINTNNPEILEQLAKEKGSSPDVIKGISLHVVDHGYDALSEKQKYHFDRVIRDLIENVPCDVYTHEFDEVPNTCSAILNDEDLVEYYKHGSGYCSSCQAQADADAHSKESFFGE